VASAPILLNVDEITTAIAAEYPTHLRDDGISGTVRLRLFVDDEGVPADIRLLESSGHREMDSAAMSVAVFLRFSPATDTNGDPLSVWVAYPIRFEAR
jgi:protein TonB